MAIKKIAITGGIGSGKSTVCKLLRDMGYSVFSCDEIYKELSLSPDYIAKIEEVFPSVICNRNIDKKKLADIVFDDPSALEKLNAIAHPLIMEVLMSRMNRTREELVFAEVPLLFEGKFEKLFDRIVVVEKEREKRIQAVCQRENIQPKKVIQRMDTQFDYDSEKGRAHIKKIAAYILKNEGSISQLQSEILLLLKNL